MLIEQKALSALENRTSSISRAGCGRANEGSERDIASALCDGPEPARGDLEVFIKKTENTPRHEIDLALSRAKLIKATQK